MNINSGYVAILSFFVAVILEALLSEAAPRPMGMKSSDNEFKVSITLKKDDKSRPDRPVNGRPLLGEPDKQVDSSNRKGGKGSMKKGKGGENEKKAKKGKSGKDKKGKGGKGQKNAKKGKGGKDKKAKKGSGGKGKKGKLIGKSLNQCVDGRGNQYACESANRCKYDSEGNYECVGR